MYISELKIQGFKSFVKKTPLTFGEGITAVVGPNGCGKTNIVDAIRWVLGEQKSSVLRGSKLEDVIFNGAEGMKPLSMCEVSLTVHNNKGKLPLEYNDVEITRRAYRDGDSEYFINRTICRLKDIHDLFMDTGMGADAYSVIELGMIEAILSETRDERKRMFEEAAGINKYKLERRSAIRKFEAVSNDLERINDIIGEVETKVHGLALQLKRFKRHAVLVEKLHDKDMELAFLRINHYIGESSPLESRIKELRHLRESNVTRENLKETELKGLKDVYRKQREELDVLQAGLNEIESEREAVSKSALVKSEQKRSTEENIQRLANERVNISSKKEQLTNSIGEHSAELDKIDPKIEEQIRLFNASKDDFEKAEESYKKIQLEVDDLQSKRWQRQQKTAELQSLYKRNEQLLTEKKSQLQRLEKRREDLELKQASNAEAQNAGEGRKNELENQLAGKKQDQEKEIDRLNSLQEELKEIETANQADKSRLTVLQSQLKFYQELIEQNEGYPDGVRHVLENRASFPKILGSLGELISSPDQNKIQLENALGPLAYCLVSSDRSSALDILDKINDDKAGHLSIIPLKEAVEGIRKSRPNPAADIPFERAIDIVQVSDEVKPLVEHLLGNLLLVKDLKPAIDSGKFESWDIIDEAGRYSGANNIIKNSQSTGDVSIIGRNQKIEFLESEMEKINRELVKHSEQIGKFSRDINQQKQDNNILGNEIENISRLLNAAEKELIGNHYSQSQTLEAIQANSSEVDEIKSQIRQSNEALKGIQPQLDTENSDLEKLAQSITAISENLENERIRRDALGRQTQELRIETMNLENQREQRLFQKRTAQETIVELENRQNTINSEVEDLKARISELTGEITSAESELTSINSKIKQKKSVFDLKQEVLDETYRSIDKLESQIRNEQRDREALLEELKDCEVKAAQYKQQIRTVRERIREKYDSDVPANLVVDESIDELVIEVDRVQRSIDSIGPINMAVQVEHDDEEERLKLLTEQKDDLVKSEENLRETISKIDRVARKRFLDTFTEIKTNFERMFSMFFEGGEGTLQLTGDPDPLEAGIAIFAQPPGKRNQSIRILSAGEKALTAIALLFSIYQVKPSPYCILDEVDAPLDDVNILKFCRVLQKFSDETQFIVVTHNKLTMEAANYLYGVTMERKGVSQLVSVKFDE